MPTVPSTGLFLHLRRIPHSKHGPDHERQSNSVILLDSFVKFGRNHELCDVVLTSSSFSSSNMISRDHAEIVGNKDKDGRILRYHIVDHSLNGTYINDTRCKTNNPTEINVGDVIKFGHMNGASIKEMQPAPQANAEFAFVVERANPGYEYLGFRDQRRCHPILCSGDSFACSENSNRRINGRERVTDPPQAAPLPATQNKRPAPQAATTVQLPVQQTTGTTATAPTASAANLAAGIWGYAANTNLAFPNGYFGLAPHLTPQGAALQAQYYRNLLAGQQQMTPGLPPSTTAASLLQRSFLQQNPQLINNLLNVSASSSVSAADMTALVAGQQQTPQTIEKEHVKQTEPTNHLRSPDPPEIEKDVKVSSPPMECDSSVPSPPKNTNPPVVPEPTIKESEELRRESTSFVDSPPQRRAPAAAPWESTPSPKPRDSPEKDVMSEKSEKSEKIEKSEKKERDTKPAPVGRHKKSNEIARLLTDLTETSWANQMSRRQSISGSRRLTDDSASEKEQKNKEREKEKERETREREREKEKERKKREKEKEKERVRKNDLIKEKEKEKEEKEKKDKARLVGAPPTSAVNARLNAKRRLKQLSDEESASSDSEEEVKTPKSSKVAQKRKPDVSSSGSESEASSVDSDDSAAAQKKKKRGRKTTKKEPAPTPKPVASKGRPKGARNRRPAAAAISESSDDEPVVTHDPTATCSRKEKCTRPPGTTVGWICCDGCDEWYHNICILGKEEPPNVKHFYCGCAKGEEMQKRVSGGVTKSTMKETPVTKKKPLKKKRSY